MDLPKSLHWIEVDLPEIIAYKQEVLRNEVPRCQLKRVSLDLSYMEARRELLFAVNGRGKRTVIASEGLLIYFTAEEVGSLAVDLASEINFQAWVIDLASPGQLKLMQRTSGKQLSEAGAAFKFGPLEGAHFFTRYGWTPKDVRGLLKTAAELNRAPAELLSLLPEPKGPFSNYPWTGVCLLNK